MYRAFLAFVFAVASSSALAEETNCIASPLAQLLQAITGPNCTGDANCNADPVCQGPVAACNNSCCDKECEDELLSSLDMVSADCDGSLECSAKAQTDTCPEQEALSEALANEAACPKVHHLRRALIHLRAAGLTKEADRIEPQLTRLETKVELDRKQAQLEALQREIVDLRKALTLEESATGPGSQVLVRCQVIEVSPQKLRAAGVDFLEPARGVATCIGADQVKQLLRLVSRPELGHVVARPTIITLSGHEAQFTSGREMPFVHRSADGEPTISYKDVGTHLKLLPTVLDNGNIGLTADVRVSRIEPSGKDESCAKRNDTRHLSPECIKSDAFRTGVELSPGQSVVLSLGTDKREAAEECRTVRIPYLGIPIRFVKSTNEDVQTIVLLSPQAMDMEPQAYSDRQAVFSQPIQRKQ